MPDSITYGLVFAGGGAKGAYQLGVWKAFDKMNIHIGAVTGTSIGAINGALYAQGDLPLALKAWRGLNLRDVISMEDALAAPDNLFDVRNISQLLHSMFRQKGLDMEPVRELLKKYIDEDKVRASSIDFGVVSFDITSQKPVEIFKNDMPDGLLLDYIMASACFPVFKSVEIDGQKFIDGGVYNNMPADMLLSRGYKHLILVDIGGVGIVRGTKSGDADIITIKPQTPLGGLFDMSPKVLQMSLRRGMLDTYRAFGRLTGRHFYLSVRSSARFVKKYGQSVLDGLETAGQQYGADPYRVYTPEKLQSAVAEKFMTDSQKYTLLRQKASHSEFRSRLLEDRPRLRKFEKDFLIPAAVDILADPNTTVRARETLYRLVPAAAGAAEALLTLGIRPAAPDSN